MRKHIMEGTACREIAETRVQAVDHSIGMVSLLHAGLISTSLSICFTDALPHLYPAVHTITVSTGQSML